VLEAVEGRDPVAAEAAMRYAIRESDNDLRSGEPPFEQSTSA
jgi:DNA-binding GntR family transcriptional regulator